MESEYLNDPLGEYIRGCNRRILELEGAIRKHRETKEKKYGYNESWSAPEEDRELYSVIGRKNEKRD